MSDLTARAIADLKAELAESKAAANRVTESMGSEILRLQGELEQQRTRAEAAEQDLAEWKRDLVRVETVLPVCDACKWTGSLVANVGEASDIVKAHMPHCPELRAIVLAPIRAHLAGWDPMALDNWARGYGKGSAAAQVFAAAREALEP